jgi:hypothetical protein
MEGEYKVIMMFFYLVVCILLEGLSNEKLKQQMKDIDLVWNNLAAFLVGGNMMVCRQKMISF